MPKYKISKENINEFFGLFGKSKKDRANRINKLIDNDPELKKIDKELVRLNSRALDRIKSDPWSMELIRLAGIDLSTYE